MQVIYIHQLGTNPIQTEETDLPTLHRPSLFYMFDTHSVLNR